MVARWFLNSIEDAGNWDFHTNGESRLIKIFSELRPALVFDVGSNEGDWSAIVARQIPSATIHSFEPVPETFRLFSSRLTSFAANVVPNNFGLSDAEGTLTVFYDREKSTVASLTNHFAGDNYVELQCHFQTGDSYCRENGIETIDLLKIDTEGADFRVLNGFKSMLSNKAIRAIQFEYGPWALHSHFLLRDTFEFLTSFGYIVGRIYPNEVEFQLYNRHLENFLVSCFVAIQATDIELINSLS